MAIGKADCAVLALIIISFAIGAYLYPQLPEKIQSHWNADGIADGFSDKSFIFMMPLLLVVFLALFIAIPKIDPMKSNIRKFYSYFEGLKILISLFLFYIFLLMIIWNLGYAFSIILALVPAFALLFYYIGIMMEKTEQNWFVGIRTPWTLSSKAVWKKTHEIGGKLFRISAIIALFGVLVEKYAIWLVIIPVLATAIITIVYSYILYRKESSIKTKSFKKKKKVNK